MILPYTTGPGGPDQIVVTGSRQGLDLCAWLLLDPGDRVAMEPRTQENALIARAHAAGLGVYPVAPLYAPTPAAARPDTAGLVMGYASLDEQAIKRGVRMLGEILETFAAEECAAAISG